MWFSFFPPFLIFFEEQTKDNYKAFSLSLSFNRVSYTIYRYIYMVPCRGCSRLLLLNTGILTRARTVAELKSLASVVFIDQAVTLIKSRETPSESYDRGQVQLWEPESRCLKTGTSEPSPEPRSSWVFCPPRQK